jgi:hypothetical protein
MSGLNGRRANTELVQAIAKYIMEDNDVTETVHELRRYKKEFFNEPDYNWYRYGNILPYYSQIRDFYQKNGFTCNDDNEIMCEHFCYHVGKAIDVLLEGYKNVA